MRAYMAMSRYLDGFAKELGQNLKLGQVFWETVTSMNFPLATTKFPYLRSAIVATNLVAPKSRVIDGISKLVVKTDMLALVRKDNILSAQAAEAMLCEAWTALEADTQACLRTPAEQYAIYGRLSSRVVLYLVKE